MAAPLRQILCSNTYRNCFFPSSKNVVIPFRTKRWDARLIEELWQQPDDAKTFEEVKKERFPEPDPEVYSEVNIGFPLATSVRKAVSSKVKISRKTSSNPELERLARKQELRVPLDEVEEAWKQEMGPHHICDVAKHFGVFRDLFGLAYFYPSVSLDVLYTLDDASCLPVCRGNVIDPEMAKLAPDVTYEAESGSLWTLVMTSPDEHLQEQDKEYLHWMVANIPENRIVEGQLLCDYLPPIPARGTGRHRYVYVLYKQNGLLDLSEYRKTSQCLNERTFDTYTFYKRYQDDLTPAGLAFCQAEWDDTVTDTFHHVLNMKEPTFEYDHPPEYLPEQELVPHKHPFNLYMDKFRDVKDINEQVLKEKFKMLNPFKPFPEKPVHPNIYYIPDHVPYWGKDEIVKRRFREEKYKILEEGH